jgi:4-carboxymuconolactone decarboxylase
MFSRREVTTLKAALISLSLFTTLTAQGLAQATPNEGQPVGTSRIERSQTKQRALFGEVPSTTTTQPELMQILRDLTYGDVYAIGNLDDKTRGLVTLVVLTTNQTLPQIKAHTHAALNLGVSPIEMREALYQAAAFIGFPKVINALEVVDEVLASRGIALPLEPSATVADHERLEKGRAIQQPIYGGRMRENLKDLPGNLPDDVSRLVTESSVISTRGVAWISKPEN